MLSTLYVFFFYNNPDFRQYTLTTLFCYGFTLLLVFLSVLNRRIKYKRILTWIIVFCLFCVSSLLWAVDSESTGSRLLEIIVKLFAVYGVAESIRDEYDFVNVVKLFLGVLIINIIYTIPSGVLNAVVFGRQNVSTGNSTSWNANSLGIMAVYSLVLISMFIKKEKKKVYKIVIAFVMLFLMYIGIASGSRKAFLFPVIYYAVLYVFSSKRGRIRKLIIGLISITIVYQLVTNIPELYELIGFRLEAAVELVLGGTTTDMSAITRKSMIEYASELVRNKPILGYGFYGFSYMYGQRTGLYTYAHNNYLDLMVGLGLIGVILYYSLHFSIIRNLRNNGEENLIFRNNQVVALVIAQLSIDFAYVSYFNFDTVMLIALCYVAIYQSNQYALIEEGD